MKLDARIRSDEPAQKVRLRQFIDFNIVLGAACALLLFVIYVFYPFRYLPPTCVLILVSMAILVLARRQVQDGRLARAIIIFSMNLLIITLLMVFM